MPIRITCQHCGKGFSAWDDLVGKAVQCPKCQQSMIVKAAGGAGHGPDPPARGGATRPAAGQDVGGPKAGGPARSQPATPKPVAPRPVARKGTAPRARTSGPASPTPPPSKSPPPHGAGSNMPAVTPPIPGPAAANVPAQPANAGPAYDTDDFDDREDLPFGCPKCNAEMEPDDDLCNACGYHLILKKVIDMEGIQRPDTSTGFDRMVKKHLDDSESTAGMLLWAKIAGLSFLVLTCFVCLGGWGLLVGVAAVIAFLIYRARLRIKAEDNPDAQIEADPLAAFMWSATLVAQRVVGWRSLEPPFASLRVLTLRDASFSNDDLGLVEDLKEYQVLDLEGTGITDAGLSHLKGRKKLRFLIVKQTAVTSAGIERLQTSIPKAWIWY